MVAPRNIYVCSFKRRHKFPERPHGSIRLNVTSQARKNSLDRITFSPMSSPVAHRGFLCFENWYQSLKRYAGLDPAKIEAWWRKQTRPRRRCTLGTGRQLTHAAFEGQKLGIVETRRLYVTEYLNHISDASKLDRVGHWITTAASPGPPIVVTDYDGPHDPVDGSTQCLEVSVPLLRQKFFDVSKSFGHGYVVAAMLAGIQPEDYMWDPPSLE